MLRRLLTFLVCLLPPAGPAFHAASAAGDGGAADPGPTPVLVELFTSEGCSSCPPADEFLSRLQRVQPVRGARIIALSQHVDYWNGLGWTDPYSSPAYTRRQREYAERFRDGRVYTPQMVVDGRTELVGNDRASALRAIAEAARTAKPPIRVIRSSTAAGVERGVTLYIRADDLPVSSGGAIEVLLAVTENGLSSSVSQGENAGSELRHDAVVRELRRLGTVSGGGTFEARPQLRFDATWNRGELGVVVFAQERDSGLVRAIGQLDLTD